MILPRGTIEGDATMAVQPPAVTFAEDGPTGATDEARPTFEAGAAPTHYGAPVTLGGFGGFFHPGGSPLAVLMLSPIGFEEMCVRSTWRSLASLIAAEGLACLRFDYPGTGDALDPVAPDGIEDWKDAIRHAADWLKQTAGVSEIALVGQGLGATLALELASGVAGVRAVVAMAAVDNGRHYLRELAAWSRIVTDSIGIGRDPLDENGLAVAGLTLPPGRAEAIKAIRLEALAQSPAADVLVVGRMMSDRDSVLADRLGALGSRVTRQDFEGYETLMTDPTQARPPMPTLARIAGWLAGLVPAGTRGVAMAAPCPTPIIGDGFEEIAGRFGPDGRLFGVLCRPNGVVDAPTLVFTNAGHDYHIGWARVTVALSRALALAGYASFRFDLDGIGDSPAHPGAPAEVLYSGAHVADAAAAVDHVAALTRGRIIMVGRCSGGYAALQAAVQRPRVTDLVIVNTQRFVWDRTEDVATAVRYGHRSVANFGATLMKRDTLRRLVRGQLNVGQAGRYILRSIGTKASRRLAPFLGGLSHQARLHRDVHRQFRALEQRGTRVSMLFSSDDAGLNEFHAYFGKHGQRLKSYRLVTMQLIPDADHNFTHRGARDRLLAALTDVLAPRSATS